MSIQSIMLVALGFLVSALLTLFIAPAFWSRAVRLTTRRIKETLPISDVEIRADKDKLRAEFAMTVHRLEAKIEQAELKRARHLVDINRRDAAISSLEHELSQVRSVLEEHENARRVLEHTVGDRLPKLDSRLGEARQMLNLRDAEIAALGQSTETHITALSEATAINAQQSAEIDRLSTALTVRGARNQNSMQDSSYDGEVALRSEIEALRAKTRDQASMIARLQHVTTSRPASQENSNRTTGPLLEIVSNTAYDEARAKMERELRETRSKIEDQASEIKTLRAERDALRVTETSDSGDSKVALRARLAGLQIETEQQSEQLNRMRAELAAANERLTQQGAHFMEQLRRLGAGTLPASAQSRHTEIQTPPRLTLAERVAQTRNTPATPPQNDSVNEPTNDAPSNAASRSTSPDAPPPGDANKARLIDRISSLTKA
ncbi:MAG: hypothetical protein HOO99_05260 [Hyphomicrobiaceae bacterium]|nr:hypothetical protein [Hyphomicrobiaceae bacterium]